MLFGVGGNKNENQQKDRINIITGSSIESTEEEEHGSASLVTKSVLNILDDKSSDDDDDDKPIVVDQDVQDTDEYNFVFLDTKLGLELITGGGRKGVVMSKVNNEELKQIFHINDIVISINNKPLPPTTVGKDVSVLIKSYKRPLLFRFSRAIRGIEERKMNKETAARATRQQEIEDETDDKEYNTDDKSMGGGTDIPKGTGVDNSDIESMSTDGKEENRSNGDGCGDESM